MDQNEVHSCFKVSLMLKQSKSQEVQKTARRFFNGKEEIKDHILNYHISSLTAVNNEKH